jgi:hypothetical protein
MTPHRANLGAVEFLSDPAEQMGLHLLQFLRCLRCSALIHQEGREIELGYKRLRMTRSEHLPARLQRLQIELARLHVVALHLVKFRQPPKTAQRVGVSRA